MKKFLLKSLLILTVISVYAQKISGNFIPEVPSNLTITLAVFEGHKTVDLETVEVQQNGQFTFENKTRPVGLYKVYLNSKRNSIDFIINQKDEIKFKIHTMNFTKYEVDNSLENRLYFSYIAQLKAKNKAKAPYKRRLKNPKISQEIKKAATDSIYKMEESFFNGTMRLINKYPNSFFSYMVMSADPDNKTDRYKYFNDIDFTDERLIRTKVLSRRYTQYIIKYGKGKKYDLMNCIDDIMDKAKANQNVYEFSAYNLLEGFYNSGYEELSSYILDEYIFGEDCGGFTVSELLKKRGNSIKKLSVGEETVNIISKDNKFRTQNLKEVAAKNEYTLVMFWSSTCNHCEEQMPEIRNLYEEYKPKGFEIYGVSLDNNTKSWVLSIAKNRMNWINTCDFKSWDSPITDDFRITRTPSFIMVGKSGKIVAKPRHVSEVKKALEALLKNKK